MTDYGPPFACTRRCYACKQHQPVGGGKVVSGKWHCEKCK